MSNSSKIIISILDFIICALIGYMGMTFLNQVRGNASGGMAPSSSTSSYSAGIGKPVSRTPSKAATPFPGSGNVESTTTPSTPSNPRPAQVGNTTLVNGLASSPEILSVSTPSYDENSKTYSFSVVASGNNLTYTLADTRKKDIQSNGTGDFRVQPSASGRYYVYITDGYGVKSDYMEVKGCYRPVNKVMKDEFQQILNSGRSQNAIDADFANRVSSGCRYEFVGIDDNEVPPGSYNEIINRIRMRTWSSVTVLSVVHSSETNKLVRARIQVNY